MITDKQIEAAALVVFTATVGRAEEYLKAKGQKRRKDFDRLIRRALEAAEAVWEPTHRHIKSGGFYRVLHKGFMEADLSPVVIYTDIVGHVWVRPTAEFFDGRFEPLPAPPKDAPDGE